MKHEIECALNAIECARENVRDATNDEKLLNDSHYIYDIANMYIDDDVVSCECVEHLKKRIENEIRELYVNIHNFEFRIERIEKTTMFHLLYSFDEFINNDTYKYMNSMIVETNNVTKYNSNFNNFRSMNELYI